MNTSTKIAMAVAGGYVLGRRRKARLAILMASVLVGRRLHLGSLGREAMGRIADSAAVGQIRDEIRGDLATTSRAAATAVLSSPLEKLADRLHEHTAALGEGDGRKGGADGGERAKGRADEEDEDEEYDDERRDRRGSHRDEDEESPRRRRAPSRTSGERTTRRSGHSEGRRAPARSARR